MYKIIDGEIIELTDEELEELKKIEEEERKREKERPATEDDLKAALIAFGVYV